MPAFPIRSSHASFDAEALCNGFTSSARAPWFVALVAQERNAGGGAGGLVHLAFCSSGLPLVPVAAILVFQSIGTPKGRPCKAISDRNECLLGRDPRRPLHLIYDLSVHIVIKMIHLASREESHAPIRVIVIPFKPFSEPLVA